MDVHHACVSDECSVLEGCYELGMMAPFPNLFPLPSYQHSTVNCGHLWDDDSVSGRR